MKRTFFLVAAVLTGAVAHAQTSINKSTVKEAEPLINALSSITRLNPVAFNYWSDNYSASPLQKGQHFGFVAEEVKEVLPEIVKNESQLVSSGKNAFKINTIPRIDLESLIPILVGSIKEQQQEIEALKKEIRLLKAQIAE